MPATSARASGKVILFGEHAVVYGQPAIAIPVNCVNARVVIIALPNKPAGWVEIEAPDIDLKSSLEKIPVEHPFAVLLHSIQSFFQLDHFPAMHIHISSTIPISSGLGSGAAVSVATIRSVTQFLGKTISKQSTAEIAYLVEKIYHGNPSGIDNTVIAYDQPVYFVRNEPFQVITPRQPFTLIIANSGIPASTRTAVTEVQNKRNRNPDIMDALFLKIGSIAKSAREIIESRTVSELGPLMTYNHELLKEIGVSHPVLNLLVDTAIKNGALGAKLCGSGMGGNIVALVRPEDSIHITAQLTAIGAVNVFSTAVTPNTLEHL